MGAGFAVSFFIELQKQLIHPAVLRLPSLNPRCWRCCDLSKQSCCHCCPSALQSSVQCNAACSTAPTTALFKAIKTPNTKARPCACKLSTQPTQPSCQEAESHLASIRTLHILGGHPSWLNCRTTIHPGSAQSWPCIKLYTFTDSKKNKSLLPHCAISWKVIADHYYTLAHKQIFKTAVQILTKRKWKWMQAYANDMKPDLSSVITTSTSSLKQS